MPGYLGCWLDDPISRDLDAIMFNSSNMTIQSCVQTCQSEKYYYAGLQNGLVFLDILDRLDLIIILFRSSQYCMCGNSYGKYGQGGAVCAQYCSGYGSLDSIYIINLLNLYLLEMSCKSVEEPTHR